MITASIYRVETINGVFFSPKRIDNKSFTVEYEPMILMEFKDAVHSVKTTMGKLFDKGIKYEILIKEL